MTGKELKRKIMTYLKRDDKDIELWDAVNETLADMIKQYPFDEARKTCKECVTMTTDDYSLPLPLDFGYETSNLKLILGVGRGYLLGKLNKDQFDGLYPNYDSSTKRAMPSCYCVFGNRILIAPKPEAVYNFKLSYVANSFAAVNEDTANVPLSEYSDAIKFGALLRLTLLLEDEPTAARYKGLYDGELSKAIAFDRAKTGSIRIVRADNF
jgi:hypothetical protein